MTANWQRPRDEHGRFVGGGTAPSPQQLNGLPPYGKGSPFTDSARGLHEFELGPQRNVCRVCGFPWSYWPHMRLETTPSTALGPIGADLDPPRAECSWWTDIEQNLRVSPLFWLSLALALLGLGFSIAALIVGVAR